MEDEAQPEAVTVFWRPGCGYCGRLFRVLERHGVAVRRRNIWEDSEARRLVQTHNGGDETVPTVAIGGEFLTNPDPKQLVDRLRAEHPHLVADDQPSGFLSRLRHS